MKLEYYVYMYLIKHYFVVSLLYFGANNPFQVSYIVVGSGKAHRPWVLHRAWRRRIPIGEIFGRCPCLWAVMASLS